MIRFSLVNSMLGHRFTPITCKTHRRRGLGPLRWFVMLSMLASTASFVYRLPSKSSLRQTSSRLRSVFSGNYDDNEGYSVKKVDRPQTVAIVGSGAVGCYYGARLYEVGHKVRFYMRGQHLEASKAAGLNVTSIDGDIDISPEDLEVFGSTESMGKVDWILVALKSFSLEAIPSLIKPLLSPKCRVLVVMNGLIEDDLIQMIKEMIQGEPKSDQNDTVPLDCCKALYGGMAFLCSNRIAPGRIEHSYAGFLSAGVASSTSEEASADRQAFEELFGTAKVPTSYVPSLLRERWRKMLWNLPFNGISVAMGGITVDIIMNDPSLRQLASEIMDETIAIANKDLEKKYGQGNFEPLGLADKEPMMVLSDSMGPYKTSTMLDLTNRQPMETRYLFQIPLERARSLGVAVPHLETIVAQIEAFQRMYKLFP